MPELNRSGFEGLAPWRGGVAWWIVLLEGIAALVVGAIILTQPGRVGQWLVWLIAGYLLVTSLLDVYVGLAGILPGGLQPYRLVAGGIGLITGLLVFALPLFTTVSIPNLIAILAIGLLGVGVVGLVGTLLAREGADLRRGEIIANVLRLVLGGLLLYLITAGAAGNVLQWLGVVAVFGGIGLIAYAILLKRSPAAAA